MLCVHEQTDERLVLRDHQPVQALMAGVFALLSGLALVTMLVSGAQMLMRGVDWLRLAALLVFMAAATGFFMIGLLALAGFSQGTWIVFDRATDSVVLRSAGGWRGRTQRFSLAAVSHLRVESNAQARAYGLFLVVRGGTYVALAAIPHHEQAHMELLAAQIRRWLTRCKSVPF